MSEIVRARLEDLSTITGSLARAFVSDPVASWLFPNAQRRIRDLETFFLIQLRHGYLPRGVVMSTTDLSSTAMWIASWSRPLGVIDRVAHLRLPILLGTRYRAARDLTRQLATTHPRSPHLYLGTIGTEPTLQSRGLGSLLIDAFIGDCEDKGVGSYLECSSEKNVGFYERRGFRVLSEVVTPRGGPVLWLMWRDANREGSDPELG